MGPFVGSDDHIVRVVNRNGNACRQARVHWLLASLVNSKMSLLETKLNLKDKIVYNKMSLSETKLIINKMYDDDKSDGLRRIVENCNLSNLFAVVDEDLEEALRDDFKASSIMRIRAIAKELGIRKLSGLRKHQLIDAVISWGYKQGGREGELRRMHPSDLVELGNILGVRIYLPINMDDVVNEFLEASDKYRSLWTCSHHFQLFVIY